MIELNLKKVHQNGNSDQLHHFQSNDKIMKIYALIPYNIMQQIYLNDSDLRPLIQCELAYNIDPEWIDRVLENKHSIFDVVHDFVNIVKEEPFFVPRI
tara:strand:+ start:318 stop:611 length:294 start_codon:yes stop_codon:yes gene_type:complete